MAWTQLLGESQCTYFLPMKMTLTPPSALWAPFGAKPDLLLLTEVSKVNGRTLSVMVPMGPDPGKQ